MGCLPSPAAPLLPTALSTALSTAPSTNLPGQPVPPVAVHLPLTDGSDQQTLSPPQLLALLDDVVPQLAGARRAAQTLRVQLAEDPQAHLCWQSCCKVLRLPGGCQRASSSTEEEHGGRPPGLLLHHRGQQFETTWKVREDKHVMLQGPASIKVLVPAESQRKVHGHTVSC